MLINFFYQALLIISGPQQQVCRDLISTWSVWKTIKASVVPVVVSVNHFEWIKMLRIVLFFTILCTSALASTPVRSCPGIPLPKAVYFGGRENYCRAEPCNVSWVRCWYAYVINSFQVHRGSDGVTEVDFSPAFVTSEIYPRVRATVFGITIEYDLGPATHGACKLSLINGICPLGPNDNATFRLALPVATNTPTVTSNVNFTLFGDDMVPIFCYQVRSTVVWAPIKVVPRIVTSFQQFPSLVQWLSDTRRNKWHTVTWHKLLKLPNYRYYLSLSLSLSLPVLLDCVRKWGCCLQNDLWGDKWMKNAWA